MWKGNALSCWNKKITVAGLLCLVCLWFPHTISFSTNLMSIGASGNCWSAETGVRQPKYGSKKKGCLSVFSALLTYDCVTVCWALVAKGWPYLCDLRARSWDLGLQRASLSRCIWLPVSVASSKPTLNALLSCDEYDICPGQTDRRAKPIA